MSSYAMVLSGVESSRGISTENVIDVNKNNNKILKHFYQHCQENKPEAYFYDLTVPPLRLCHRSRNRNNNNNTVTLDSRWLYSTSIEVALSYGFSCDTSSGRRVAARDSRTGEEDWTKRKKQNTTREQSERKKSDIQSEEDQGRRGEEEEEK
ncbi:uncharacterized protein LOC107267915 [Cephus cinctus]|uniref:Uncharacterized protein LOC107267915 n=1 Tax=Cephus cinctus TaxID=211228 RepID=A0AAJ7BWE7_CEPCN|nr:uncharacterized protein LOC107267915 [Cephus cinctus]